MFVFSPWRLLQSWWKAHAGATVPVEVGYYGSWLFDNDTVDGSEILHHLRSVKPCK